MNKNWTTYSVVSALVCVSALSAGMAAEVVEQDALTLPSEIRQLSFVRPGLISEVLVAEGDTVKVGQVLVRQDNRAEQLELAQLQMEANDQTRIEFSKASLAVAESDLARTERAYKQGAATDMELEHAQLEMKVKQATVDVEELNQKEVVARFKQMEVRVDQMQIKSPIDGKIERINLRQGEGTEALEKVIAVIKTDTLWINVSVNIVQARQLKLGQSASVQFINEDGVGGNYQLGQTVTGKIIFKASMANAGALTVRLEVPNPTDRPAGERAMVRFGSTSGDGASTSGDGASTSGDGASTSGDGASTSGDGANTTGDGINAAGEQAKASLSEHVNKMMQSAGRWALWFARGINCNYPAAYGPSATGGEIASANLPGL